jgi:hypothetical protein
MVEWSEDPAMLRRGIAVQGRIICGVVEDDDGLCYRLKYTYKVQARTMDNTIAVSPEQYARYTTGNPYITILYDPKKPEVSKPYFKVTAAHLST